MIVCASLVKIILQKFYHVKTLEKRFIFIIFYSVLLVTHPGGGVCKISLLPGGRGDAIVGYAGQGIHSTPAGLLLGVMAVDWPSILVDMVIIWRLNWLLDRFKAQNGHIFSPL